MCERCEKLKKVPKDKKETVVLVDAKAIDAEVYKAFMQLNHRDDGTPFAFLKSEVVIKSTGRSYGIVIDITHCPFCGERLC